MEVVAAADSDERGLAFLSLVNVFRKLVAFIFSFTGENTSSTDTGTQESEVNQETNTDNNYTSNLNEEIMAPLDDTEIFKKVS